MNPPQTFLYVLRLVDRLRIETGWTDGDNAATARHFQRLKERLAEGTLILAGKTAGLDENTFGLVIFEAASEEEARERMNTDPAVAEGIMTATLYPYNIALMRGSPA